MAAVFIQLYLVPRVESRKRREDRWERWVLDLGEFLTFDLADAASAYSSALYGLVALAEAEEQPGMFDATNFAEWRRERLDEVRACRQTYGRACERARWMTERLRRIDNGQATLNLNFRILGLAVGGLDDVDPTFKPADWKITSAVYGEASKINRERSSAVVEAYKVVAALPTPVRMGRFAKIVKRIWAVVRREKKNK